MTANVVTTLVGVVRGGDPEMRYLGTGTEVTNLSLAVKSGFKREGDEFPPTMWWRLTFWGKAAESANQYIRNGSGLVVSGEINYDQDTGSPKLFTRKDGTVSASFELNVREWSFLPRTAGAGDEPASESTPAVVEEDEIPF